MSTPMNVEARGSGVDARRSALGQLLVLLGLTGFAIAQPMLDVLGRNPSVFTFNDVSGWALVWIAVLVAFAPALVLWGIGRAVTRIDARVGYVVHAVTVAGLVLLAALQVLKWTVGLTQPVLLVLASAAVAGGFTALYLRFRPVAEWARYTSVLPALAVVLFLTSSSSGDLVRSRSAAARTDAGEEMPSVVFVLLDELPTKTLLDDEGAIDEVRFPNLAELAGSATWYRNHTTVAPWTDQAIPAILTGRDPELVDPLWTEYPDNLFALLEPTHDLSVFESYARLCGSSACVEGPPGSTSRARADYAGLGETLLDLWVTRISPRADADATHDDFDEARSLVSLPTSLESLFLEGEELDGGLKARPSRHQAFIDALTPGDRPSFHFLHLLLPHVPWRFYPDGELYEPVDVGAFDPSPVTANDVSPWASAFTELRHVWQTQYTDALVGAVVDRLEELGRYDDSLIVVMSDHGISFDHGVDPRHVDERTLDDIAYAPLIIKAPGQTTGEIDDSNLMSIDVLPTLADLLGIDLPWATDGHPAGSAAIRERGPSKYILGITRTFGHRAVEGIITFDQHEHAPSAADRWVAPARPGGDPLSTLLQSRGADEYLGRSLDELLERDAAPLEAAVYQRRAILEPPAGPKAGWIHGAVRDAPDEALVLAEVKGTIVSASPSTTRGANRASSWPRSPQASSAIATSYASAS